MKVLLIDVDSKLPNLALMKLAAHHKNDDVSLVRLKKKEQIPNEYFDKIYASCIFTRNSNICEKLKATYQDRIEIGGTGVDVKKRLPREVEKLSPDYSLYDIDYGIGYSARGCIRNCEFCFVPKKEGRLQQDVEISQLLSDQSKKLYLLDNNFAADPQFKNKAKWLINNEVIVDINSGIDVRVLTEEKAELLSKIKHMNYLKIAWDLKSEEKYVLKGIELLTKYIKPYKIMCYVLVGFNTDLEYDLYRINKLKELKIAPYVMVYNKRQDGYYKYMQRWVNTFLYRNTAFEDYEYYKKYLQKQKLI